MSQYNRTNYCLSIYFVIYILALLLKLIYQVKGGYSKVSYGITEWMVNYQGGFVRRGLSGEIIYQLYQLFGISPYYIILFLCLFSMFIVIVFFTRQFIKKRYPIFILPFVLFLGNLIINELWIKKDGFIILFFILAIFIYVKHPRFYLIWINIVLAIGILIHEVVFFISTPILLVLLYNDYKQNRRLANAVISSVFSLLPVILTFILISYFHGSKEIVSTIWQSWQNVPFPNSVEYDPNIPKEAVVGIGLTLKEGLLKSYLNNIIVQNIGVYAIIMWLLTFILAYYISINVNLLTGKVLFYKPKPENIDKKNLSNIIFFQFCFVFVPLLIIGCDYGRWIFFWIMSSFALILLIPSQKTMSLLPTPLVKIENKIENCYNRICPASNDIIVLLCIIMHFPWVHWEVLSTYTTNSVYIVLNFLTIIIDQIRGLIS